MATLRPAINPSDGYLQKIIKYIPTEIVAAYIALIGYLSVPDKTPYPDIYRTYYLITIVILVIITPIWTFYGVYDKETAESKDKFKQALFHAFISLFAILIWIYAMGNVILQAIICNCNVIGTDCSQCPSYSKVLGSIILILFTVLAPLIERIILGTKLPAVKA